MLTVTHLFFFPPSSSTLLLSPETGDSSDPRRVIVEKMSLVSDGKELSLDLTGDLSQLKSQPLIVKEGVQYRIKVYFRYSNGHREPLASPAPATLIHPLLAFCLV